MTNDATPRTLVHRALGTLIGVFLLFTAHGATWATEFSSPASPRPLADEPPLSVGYSSVEFIGPLAAWLDLKATLGAVGDGVADDTEAIQNGLDALRRADGRSGPTVLYFPPGSYRITRTLNLRLKAGASLVGAGSATTAIVWGGPEGGTMLLSSGSSDTLFERLRWDGQGKAAIGIAQWWNFTADHANYQGGVKHLDEVFENLGIGIYGGRVGKDYGQGDSETLIERVTFIANRRAGVNVGSFNALNWWIWDSEFRDCARGVSNEFSVDDHGPTAGAGNFAVYRSLFLRSTVADVSIGNTGWFALRDNVSIGSARFFVAERTGANSAAMILQDNRIIDTNNAAAIEIGNEGPLILLDNQFRSLPTAAGPVVRLHGDGITRASGDRDMFSMGNRFTVADPVRIEGPGGRRVSVDDTIVTPDHIDASLPVLPPPASAAQGSVFEVPAGANADRIQGTIDAASDAAVHSALHAAIVHIAPGDYQIAHTLVVPAGVRLQIAGDAEATSLYWTGGDPAGTLLRFEGPSLATLRDLRIIGAHVRALLVRSADQAGGRIVVEGSNLGGVRLAGLAQTHVELRSNAAVARLDVDASRHVVSVGSSGLGPIRLTRQGRLMVSESWYEGKRADLFRGDSGEFTYLGGLMAPYVHGIEAGLSPDTPAFLVDGFAGQISVVGLQMDLSNARNAIAVTPAGASSTALFLGINGLFGRDATQTTYFRILNDNPDSVSAGGTAATLLLAKVNIAPQGAHDIPDVGSSNAAMLRRALEPIRKLVWEHSPFVPAVGTTQVRLFRVIAPDTGVALDVTP